MFTLPPELSSIFGEAILQLMFPPELEYANPVDALNFPAFMFPAEDASYLTLSALPDKSSIVEALEDSASILVAIHLDIFTFAAFEVSIIIFLALITSAFMVAALEALIVIDSSCALRSDFIDMDDAEDA